MRVNKGEDRVRLSFSDDDLAFAEQVRSFVRANPRSRDESKGPEWPVAVA